MVDFTSTASDGRVYESNANYNTCWDGPDPAAISGASGGVFVGQQLVAGNYSIYRGFVFFDTSALPDAATVTGATLKLMPKTIAVTGGDFDVVVQSGMPVFPSDPLVAGDYTDGNYAGNYGSINTAALVADNYASIVLANPADLVNLTGTTKLCLRHNDDIAKSAPAGTEKVYFYAGVDAGKEPTLVVTYTLGPPPPIISTTDISGTDNDPKGITFDGKYLYWVGTQNNSIYQWERSGNLVRTINVAAITTDPVGITTDGKYLWITDDTDQAAAIHQLDKLGNLISTIAVEAIDNTPFGITTDGKYLWWIGQENSNIYQMDKLGNLIQTIDVSAIDTTPTGITTDGKYLWICGDQNNSIYQLDKSGNLIQTIGVAAVDTAPYGITTDGKYLWWVGGQNDNIYQMAK